MPCESQDRSSGVTRLGHPRNSDLRNGDDVECAMTCAKLGCLEASRDGGWRRRDFGRLASGARSYKIACAAMKNRRRVLQLYPLRHPLTPPTMQHRKDEAHLRSDSCYRPASTLLPAFAGERTSALVVWINSHHVVASPEPACVSVSSLCSVHRNPGCGAESYGWTGFVAGPVDLGGRTDMPRDRLHSALDLPEARPTRAKISLG